MYYNIDEKTLNEIKYDFRIIITQNVNNVVVKAMCLFSPAERIEFRIGILTGSSCGTHKTLVSGIRNTLTKGLQS